jgi:hypothetical protein
MGEKPSVRRVRVLVIFYKWINIPKCVNIDTKVSYRVLDFRLVFVKITTVIE